MLTPDEIQRVLAAARGCGKKGGEVVSLDDLIEEVLIRQAKEAGIGPMPSVEEILDRVLRTTFDWWSDQQQRDIASDGGDDMEKFIGLAKEVCRRNFSASVFVPAADDRRAALERGICELLDDINRANVHFEVDGALVSWPWERLNRLARSSTARVPSNAAVIQKDVVEKGYAAVQVCVGAILGGNLAFGSGTDAVLRHLQALASALRQGGQENG